MEFIKSYKDLNNQVLRDREQFWYYVILFNPYDITRAGKLLLANLEWFHLKSGASVVYFITGFLNTSSGIVQDEVEFLKGRELIEIPEFGTVQFYTKDFYECIRNFEMYNPSWKYSGECELLLFNLDKNGRIDRRDFAAYNLDDIVRGGNNLSSFILETINVGTDATDKLAAKRRLDEVYSSLIMPPVGYSDSELSNFNAFSCLGKSFIDQKYYFISYSSRDIEFVKKIKTNMESHGVKCWMAPFDIRHGENYAHVLEFAIKYADKFILMLPENSVQSIWVEKELLRAIHYFQHDNADKIMPVWLYNQFDLNNTPFAFIMEGVQVAGVIDDGNNYKLLLPPEERINAEERNILNEAAESTLRRLDSNIITSDSICGQFQKALAAPFGFVAELQKQRFGNADFISKTETLKLTCNRLRENVQKMKTAEEPFGDVVGQSIVLLSDIRAQIVDIQNAINEYKYL